MVEWIETLLTISILILIFLLIWARVAGQRVLDCLNEIRDFIMGWKEESQERMESVNIGA